MKLETVIDLYGFSKGKHLVLRRGEENLSETFKAIRKRTLELWDVDSHKRVVVTERIYNVTEDKESVMEDMEQKFLSKVFTYAFE